MTGSSSDVEILVHVTALSTTAHDAVYRQYAHSYLAFEPHSRDHLGPEHLSEPSADEQGHRPEQVERASSPGPEVVFDFESQDLSFRSALDNRSSPRLHPAARKVAEKDVIPSSQGSQDQALGPWRAPPSQIEDSYPLPDADLMFISPTRVLHSHLRNSGISISSSPSNAAAAPKKRDIIDVPSSLPVPEPDQETSRVGDGMTSHKVIPATPAQSGILRRRGLDYREQDDSILDVTHISSSAISIPSPSSPSFRAESEPLPSKRRRTELIGDEKASLLRSSSDTGLIQQSAFPIPDRKHLDDALEIRAPSPPAGTDDLAPSQLISEKLAKLACDISSRYRPQVRRATEPFERGYWRLDCGAWDDETRRDLWLFLTNYIESGLAGWGVWCRRDASRTGLRLYSWAHVAKHMYLLLYIGSGRRLKFTGTQWVGADGEVVLEVPPHNGASK